MKMDEQQTKMDEQQAKMDEQHAKMDGKQARMEERQAWQAATHHRQKRELASCKLDMPAREKKQLQDWQEMITQRLQENEARERERERESSVLNAMYDLSHRPGPSSGPSRGSLSKLNEIPVPVRLYGHSRLAESGCLLACIGLKTWNLFSRGGTTNVTTRISWPVKET